jgi:predicted ATP-dependent serine protease
MNKLRLMPTTRDFDLGINDTELLDIGSVEVPEYFKHPISFGNAILNGIFNDKGLIKSQVITVSSPKGSGKTTLLMQALQKLVDTNPDMKCAYFSNEECVQQLAYTAHRIGVTTIKVGNVSHIDTIANHMKDLDVVVIDSFPGLTHDHITSPKAIEHYAISTLVAAAKTTKCVLIFIMHFTKDGKEAGGKSVFHAVDTTITITKMDPDHIGGKNCRQICVDKNRMGSQTEVILQMTATGFDLDNPIEVASDESEEKGVYASRKETDIKAIMGKIRSNPNISAKLSDFVDLDIDLGRVERLLKELVAVGRLTMHGGGKGQAKESKRWLPAIDDDEQLITTVA